jgi:hypothetical protein
MRSMEELSDGALSYRKEKAQQIRHRDLRDR